MLSNLKTSGSLYRLLTYILYILTFITHDGTFLSFGKSFKSNLVMMISFFFFFSHVTC